MLTPDPTGSDHVAEWEWDGDGVTKSRALLSRMRPSGSATSTKTSTSGKLASLAGLGLPIRKVYVFLPALQV